MEGEGKYQFHDGTKYEGIFKRNLQDGYGQAKYPGGTIYVGEWRNGYPHGNGRVVYKGGIKYEGFWREGKRHGQGLLSLPNGSYYEGGFCRGRFQGKGTFISKNNGLKYVGGFDRGFVASVGTVTFPNGQIIRKEWPNESLSGLTIHEAIAYIEKENKEKQIEEKNHYDKLHGFVQNVKIEERVAKVREAIKRRKKEENERKMMEIRIKFREKQRNNETNEAPLMANKKFQNKK